jgi:hypothetical protein
MQKARHRPMARLLMLKLVNYFFFAAAVPSAAPARAALAAALRATVAFAGVFFALGATAMDIAKSSS